MWKCEASQASQAEVDVKWEPVQVEAGYGSVLVSLDYAGVDRSCWNVANYLGVLLAMLACC